MNGSAATNSKERIVRTIIDQYLKRQDNLYDARKLFMAVTVINWVFEQNAKKETFEKYMNFVFRYLNDEIDLFWEDGTIHFKALKK